MAEVRERWDRLAKLGKDAVDTAVGLGVLGLQRLQVGRVQLEHRLASDPALGPHVQAVRSHARRRVGQLEGVAAEVLRTIESTLQPIAQRLPEPARQIASVAQERLDEVHAKVRRHLTDPKTEAGS
jgi:hypothetical protein